MKQSWHIVNKETKEIILATKKFWKVESLAKSLISATTDDQFQIQYFRRLELAETCELQDYFNC